MLPNRDADVGWSVGVLECWSVGVLECGKGRGVFRHFSAAALLSALYPVALGDE